MSTNPNVEVLFKPLTIGNLTLPNRIGMAALTRNRSSGNVPNEYQAEHYIQRAKGGAGIIVTEGILVSQQGSPWEWAPGLWSEEHVIAWKGIIDAVHDAVKDSVIFAQLWHLGRVSHPDAPEQIASKLPVYGPSAIAAAGGKFRFLPGQPGYVTPTAIKDPFILVNQFKQAAVNAKAANFDGIEILGNGGYLIQQFLDTRANQRTDQWGGSVENRSRFGLEVLKAVVEVWGPKKVGIKLMPAGGYNDIGMPLDETIATYSYFISEADKLDLAYFSLMQVFHRGLLFGNPSDREVEHDVFATYRPYIKHAALFANGAVDPVEAAELVRKGLVDGVMIGRPWISNPDLVKRVERDIPWNMNIDVKTVSVPGLTKSIGYNDYPVAT